MTKPEARPTDAELDILHVLWTRGPSTVRDVHEALSQEKEVRYTTTLKQLQVMLDKGLVQRDDARRSHIYSAAENEEETQGRLLDHLLEHAFGGSTSKLFMRALDRKRASERELEEIRRLLANEEEG